MVIITKVILAVEKIEQKYGCSFSIIMSMSLVLGQVSQVICVVKPGIFVSYDWSCSCNMLICPASYKRSHLGKKKTSKQGLLLQRCFICSQADDSFRPGGKAHPVKTKKPEPEISRPLFQCIPSSYYYSFIFVYDKAVL